MVLRRGNRLVSPRGVEVLVAWAKGIELDWRGVRFKKSLQGSLSDGDEPFVPFDRMAHTAFRPLPTPPDASGFLCNGKLEVVVIGQGLCDLRYNGEPMQPKSP